MTAKGHLNIVLLTGVQLTTTSRVRAENEIIKGGIQWTQRLNFNEVLCKSIGVTPL